MSRQVSGLGLVGLLGSEGCKGRINDVYNQLRALLGDMDEIMNGNSQERKRYVIEQKSKLEKKVEEEKNKRNVDAIIYRLYDNMFYRLVR